MEMVILVGIAGSGKTTWCEKALPHHAHISLDNIKQHSRNTEGQMVDSELQNGNNVVIDDTNLTRDIRKRHIAAAQKYEARVNAVFFDIDIDTVRRQNLKRDKKVSGYVLDEQKRQLEKPSEEEGIDFIQTVH